MASKPIKKLLEHIKPQETNSEPSKENLDPYLDIKKALEEDEWIETPDYWKVGRLFIVKVNWDYDPENADWIRRGRDRRDRKS